MSMIFRSIYGVSEKYQDRMKSNLISYFRPVIKLDNSPDIVPSFVLLSSLVGILVPKQSCELMRWVGVSHGRIVVE